MQSVKLDLAMVAGEVSGDLLAAVVLGGVRQRHPGWLAGGIGGEHMRRQGFEVWWPSDALAVRGYVEVLRHYRRIVGIRDALRHRLLTHPPGLFLGVDAPDFNLALERDLKSAGVPTVHLVCPSIWAWRPERVHTLKTSVDHVLCIFPFEPALLARHGIAATYVGHPLAPLIPMEPDQAAARRALGLQADGPVVALLPGSRASEIKYLGRTFFQAARLIVQARPTVQLVVPCVPSQRAAIERCAADDGLGTSLVLVDGQSHAALAACDVTLIASGTATLEAALFKRPMVIAYRMNWLSWEIMRRKQLQPWVGLPNILCEEHVVPELLQGRATPQALAAEVLAWLDAPERVLAVQARFQRLHETLIQDTVGLSLGVLERLMGRIPEGQPGQPGAAHG
ncbi:MAG: lipid-A-disaccharide synthase [Burkholderiaceae bacterium]|nr:lipid-A-disaccharide synthase [Burkholderiaceae bacterium]